MPCHRDPVGHERFFNGVPGFCRTAAASVLKQLHFISMLALGCGCAHHYEITSIARSDLLRTNAGALVILPRDAARGAVPYRGSGREVALTIKHALETRMAGSDLTLSPGEERIHLNAARNKFDHLVVPTIAAWENEAWTGRHRSLHAAIELRFIETRNGRVIAMGRVEGTRRRDRRSADGPPELLDVPLRSYINWRTSPLGTPLPPHATDATARVGK